MNLENFMKQYAKDLETESFKTDVPGVYVISLDEDINITISENPGGFALFAEVAPYPTTTDEEKFITDALTGNLYGKATGGAIFGVNENLTLLTLQRTVNYEISYKTFKEVVEDFITAIDFWREELAAYK